MCLLALVLIALNRSHVSAIVLQRNEASRGLECDTYCTQARPGLPSMLDKAKATRRSDKPGQVVE